MKVTCQSCQAKYTIADEKVRGKVAKIRCKKCGTTIIVNGSDDTNAQASDAAQSGAVVADYTTQSSGDEAWTILVGDDQRTVSTAEISDLYVSGTISMETSAWKEGMPDWLSISEIEALRSVLENGPRPTMTPLGEPANGAEGPASRRSIADAAPAAKTAGVIAARARTPEPAAVRRAGRGGAVDMFGAAAHEDVLTSASANPAAHAGEDKMTGARNENSVLFSLSALTGGDSKASSSSSAHKDEPISGKADLRALMGSSDTLGRQPAARSKLDDIMNLGGGGVYSPALMAPALSPPSVDFSGVAAENAGGESKSKSKTLILSLLGGVALVAVAAVAFSLGSKSDVGDKSGATGAASAAASSKGATAQLAAETPAPAPEPTTPPVVAAPAPTPESAPTVLAPGQATPKPSEPEKKAAAPKVEKAAPVAAAEPRPAPPPEPKPAPVAAPAAGGSGDFDRASALTALSAAASSAQSCKKADGPTGAGRIAVTFANNGAATTAAVEGPPFAGTPVGGCVAARFRGAHVPPFGGSPVTVHKSFNIN